MSEPSDVVIRRALVVPLPWRIREHPERHRTARGTLVRETLVALAVHHSPILDTLQRIERVERLQEALCLWLHWLGWRRPSLTPHRIVKYS